MSKGLKIFLGIVVALGVISAILLVFAKKKPTTVQNQQASGQVTKSSNVALNNQTAAQQTPSTGLPVQTPSVTTSVGQAQQTNTGVNNSSAQTRITNQQQGSVQQQVSNQPQTSNTNVVSSSTVKDSKALAASQWDQCKAKTMQVNTNLFWSVQITEGIPLGGTYAKGSLDGNTSKQVHVIVKSTSQLADKIKARLLPGKAVFLRGNCTGVADDGSVILQAF